MELRNLKTYVKVCELASFSKAAEVLGYSQSTVTAQIQQLENELGVMLFERTGKHFTVSEKGREFFTYAEDILNLALQACRSVTDTETPMGTLRVGIIESMCSFALPLFLEEYMIKYPEVDLVIKTATTLEIMDMLRKNQVDLIVTLDEPVYDIEWTRAWKTDEDIIFLCSGTHPFAEKKSVRLKDLLGENLILTEKGCNYRQTFELICGQHGLEYNSTLEIGNTNIILELTEKGRGVTFLPRITAQKALEDEKLASFDVEGCLIKMEIQLIHKKNKWVSPAMKEFIRMVDDNVKPFNE